MKRSIIFIVTIILTGILIFSSVGLAKKPTDKEIADHVQQAVKGASHGANTAAKQINSKNPNKSAEPTYKVIYIKGYEVWIDPIRIWG